MKQTVLTRYICQDSAMPRSAKSASRARQNIVLLISMAKKTSTVSRRTPKTDCPRWRRGNPG
ncbi:hypothetical protein KCP71_12570 [Salmonella enterica subsp. enterica]|nr:hypothetical protein KCP71_12570 [Salmonella enterica subsp. enterica]